MTHTKLAPVPSAKAVGDRRYRFKLSDGSLDRDGDVIDAEGWDLSEYQKNPVVLWSHDLKIPAIGRSPHIAVERDALVGDVQFPPEGVYPFADQVRGLVDAGILTTSSVGFRPIRGTPTAKGHHFHEQQLLEWSIVNVPSNPSASLQGMSQKAKYDAAVKSLMGIVDSRAVRLQPHVRGLDEVRLKSFLARSDQHPTAYCPRGLRCPAKASQMQPSQCPERDCPVRATTGKDAVFDIDLGDTIDRAYLPAIRDAMVAELSRQARVMSRNLINEVVRPALREHRLRTTGRVD